MRPLEKALRDDPELKALQKKFDAQVIAFIREHTPQLLSEADSDNESEVPHVPTFDKYLKSLKPSLRREMAGLGYFNGLTEAMARRYRTIFYRSTLPNLMEAEPVFSNNSGKPY